MRAYYFDDIPGDQRLPHDSGIPVGTDVLVSLGLHYTYVPVPFPLTDDYPEIDTISSERGYIKRDFINVTKEGLGDIYEAKIKAFFHEHMHEEEEIRYVVQGSGYFDIREHPTDKWVRCALTPGDLIVVPAGIYHRFTLDDGDMIKAMMLFKEEPLWSYYNRGEIADANPYRVEYLKKISIH